MNDEKYSLQRIFEESLGSKPTLFIDSIELLNIPKDEARTSWTHAQAKEHTLVERLLERCAAYGGVTCGEKAGLAHDDWCERCLAAEALTGDRLPPVVATVYIDHKDIVSIPKVQQNYPEPFSDAVPVHPELLAATVENAHVEAASPYGDEGDGYDMHLMTQVLIDQGWTPPAPFQVQEEVSEPLLMSSIRRMAERDPQRHIRIENGSGTTVAGFVREVDEWIEALKGGSNNG